MLAALPVLLLAGCNEKPKPAAESEMPTDSAVSGNTKPSTSAQPAENKTPEPSRSLMGGWNESKVTPEARKALDFVLKQMNATAKLDKILAVKTQIVAGRNYDILFRLDNGEKWRTVVYQDLKGNYKITEHPAKQDAKNN